MGEVVEISMLGNKLNIYAQLLRFLTDYIDEDYTIQSIQAIDNWKYDNLVSLNSFSDISEVVKDKIIYITIKTKNEYIGISIEKNKNLFNVEGWINSNVEIKGREYDRFINTFVDTFKHNKSMKVCGIGKEIYVDFNLGVGQAIENAHNIDVWLINSDENINFRRIKQKVIYIQ